MTVDPSAVVTVRAGRLRGRVQGTLSVYRGIPYAASPVGPLRFSPPREVPAWPGIRDSTAPGPAAPQLPSRLEGVMGTPAGDRHEDGCLTVNVWTPTAALRDGRPRPVLLWLHGGGWVSGSAGWDWYDGARLAERGDIVVVTANHRLGPLGYLHLPEIDCVNLGLRDQAAALRWVRDEIGAFGGDPEAITLGGQSAGAYSALALATSRTTAPLVRRLLLQSCPWGVVAQSSLEAAERTARLIELLGLAGSDEPVEALRATPVEALLEAHRRLAEGTARRGAIAPPLHPVLGGPYLERPMMEAVENGALGDTDLMVGSTREEMTAYFALDPAARRLTRDEAVAVIADWVGPEAAPRVYARHAERSPEAAPVEVLTAVGGAHVFGDGGVRLARIRARQGRPGHVYRFDRRPPGPLGAVLGACHCADLPFFFDTLDAFAGAAMLGDVGPGDRDLAVEWSGAAAAFVAGGVPRTTRPWPPYDGEDDASIHLV